MRLETVLASLEDVKGNITFQSLRVHIENPRGSIRSGTDKKTGRKWSVEMTYPYGEIVGYDGVDGDPVDCFIGPDPTSKWVHVVHILAPDGSVDEDKCMLGWNDAQQAKHALLENYDGKHFYGGMDTLSMDEFKKKLKENGTNGPKIIRAQAKNFKVGDEVFYDSQHANKGVVRKVIGRRVIIQTLSNLVLSRDISSVHHWDEARVSKTWVGAQ